MAVVGLGNFGAKDICMPKTDRKPDDWRTMSADEWDKMLEGFDKYIETFQEENKKLREAQEKAATRAALEAPPDRKAIAAGQAALLVAAGFGGGTCKTEAESDEDNGYAPDRMREDAAY